MDFTTAIKYAQLVSAAYAVAPASLANAAGTTVSAGGTTYTVVTSIYACDLATDLNPDRGKDQVSIGLILQAAGTGDVVIAIRGTEGIMEWIHDAEFLTVPCPFPGGAGRTEDGFTAMYNSLRTSAAVNAPSVKSAMANLPFAQPVRSLTVCGHSMGSSLATLLALDLAANSRFKNPTVYTYASPRTGDPAFVTKYDQVVPNTYRIANRIDLVPKLPLPPQYGHVQALSELNPVQLFPPKVLVKLDIGCQHYLDTYLHLLSLRAGGAVLPLDSGCMP